MSSYIGKVQVGSGDQILIGSTLSGICSTAANTAAKVVTLPDFDTLMKGVTVHVRFTSGNSVTSGVTLAVGTTTAYPVIGNCVCNVGDTIPFTYYEDSTEHTWYANTNIVVAEGTTNGTIKVNGQDATVHGLGTAAYTPTTNYATAAQGTLADNAMPISGGTFTGAVSGPAVSDASPSGTLATIDYVQSKTAGLSGLTGAMHFKGTTTTAVTDGSTQNPTVNGNEITVKEAGDVVLYENQEYVWSGSAWELLGDEGSYALKSNYKTVTFTTNTLATLTKSQVSVPNITGVGSLPTLDTEEVSIPKVTGVGAPTTMEVSNGILQITIGSAPTLDSTNITATKVKSWDAGSVPSLGTAIEFDAVGTFNGGSQASINISGDNVVLTASPST